MKKNRFNLMRQIPAFQSLSYDELSKLDRLARFRILKKKTILYSEGGNKQSIFFIVDGLVKTYRDDEYNRPKILAYYKNGDFFPQGSLFSDSTYTSSAACIVQTTVIVLPLAPLRELLQDQPSIALKIMHVLGERIENLQQKVNQLTSKSEQHRGQMFLLKLAEHCGDQDNGEIRIGIPMTYQEFADTIGSTRDQARKFIIRLRNGGIVDMQRSGFVIHDVEALKQWQES